MAQVQEVTSITPFLDVPRILGRAKSTVYAAANPKSEFFDPDFPVPFKIGRSTFVVTAELEAYIQKKIAARDQLRTAA